MSDHTKQGPVWSAGMRVDVHGTAGTIAGPATPYEGGARWLVTWDRDGTSTEVMAGNLRALPNEGTGDG